MDAPPLRVGSVVVATRDCDVFHFGEVGVVYETYRLGDRPGWSVIFARGGHDGFSAEDVRLCLHVTGRTVPELTGYRFEDVGRLRRDYEAGRFAPAFAQSPGRGGRG